MLFQQTSRVQTGTMSFKNYNASASGSQSPSSENPSSNTSPSIVPTPLSGYRTSDDTDSQSTQSRDTPSKIPIDLPRPSSASKGGCWTCRLRRKKCDEQRENDSCQTCIRLKIKCLGWGSKRPEWMRDKQAVEAYKADIKAQLTRAGLIRGQPRATILQATASASPTYSSRPYQTGSRRGTPGTPIENSSTNNFDFVHPPHGHINNPTLLPVFAQLPQNVQMPTYNDPNLHSVEHITFSPSTPSHQSGLSPDIGHFDPFRAMNTTVEYDPQPHGLSPLPSQSVFQEEHVLYYFEHVRKLQFVFAGNNVTNITYSLVLQEPQGAVTNSICALANLHFNRMRMAHNLQVSDPSLDNAQARAFYENALSQISGNMGGHIRESDAIAALHLLSFSLLSGGSTDWRPMLDFSCRWLTQIGIIGNENPKLAMLNMTAPTRLALKATMWLDIMSSISLMRPPRYMDFYRRLFRGGSGYWAASHQSTIEDFVLRMDNLTGCPDDVLLALAEISTLSHWKVQEMRKGSLSMRGLIRRGDQIEQHLRSHPDPTSFSEVDPVPLHPHFPSLGMGSHSPHEPTRGQAMAPFPTEDARRSVAGLFREAAVLYLHTVLSDSNPGVPEIIESVNSIMNTMNQLHPSVVDRSLMFPLFLAGCMTDDRIKRETIKARLQTQDECFGNIHQIRRAMEVLWQQRDSHGGSVEWREMMSSPNFNLLLV
ncbi:hypothetical protein SERLA73DRAFT_181398 [Serpula lacrymans var. lacrymans S7.3]|uniref:Zn(2)-C6 fungal-type domain-containing protein n=2 Tax=Serpula lacrymans var. lacrymans TaxID=341189 RepID=F8PY02_SERL3|nr:uncharacterized protein SERLADRAFT_467528 [Serpula lacrymans var. lacrymans S7.9]EGN98765.1 hypothetical protein SERLA73DRAFT_181398 [Serpula lacrymans var. lacrymans S7.3]EGO24359.1 hypothetical protein SERLADRAFT_467528 [Serpula lacrymans var. lacrymans S7.9]